MIGAYGQQAYVDPGIGMIFKDAAGKGIMRFNVGAHQVIRGRFGPYLTLESRKSAPGESENYFRDIFGVSARVYKMIEVYGGAGLFKQGLISQGFKFSGVRKEIGVSAYFEKIKLSVDLGYSKSNGPSLNVGYAIPLGGRFSRGKKEYPDLQFPLETIYAEIEKNHLRELISKVTFSLSTGSGEHFFKHKLQNIGIYQSDTLGPLLIASAAGRPASGTKGWITSSTSKPIPANAAPGEFITDSDTTYIYRVRVNGVPLVLQASVKIKSFTAGVGLGLDLIGNTTLRLSQLDGQANLFPKPNNLIRPVKITEKNNVSISKFFLYGGYDFYRIEKWVFKGDVLVGQISVGRNFNVNQIRPGLFFNGGLNVRRDMSEYLSVFVRPSIERKTYFLTPPDVGTEIKHRINSVYLNVGVNYNIPALPRCYITACRTQIDHAHGNRQYRSRVHPMTRKQNPGYGENKVRVKPNRTRTKKDGAIPR